VVEVLQRGGFPLVPWHVCTMPKDEGGLGLINVATQGFILVAKWALRCLEGDAPWYVLFWHRMMLAQHVGRCRGLLLWVISSLPPIYSRFRAC
jgi:hypothetical protein